MTLSPTATITNTPQATDTVVHTPDNTEVPSQIPLPTMQATGVTVVFPTAIPPVPTTSIPPTLAPSGRIISPANRELVGSPVDVYFQLDNLPSGHHIGPDCFVM